MKKELLRIVLLLSFIPIILTSFSIFQIEIMNSIRAYMLGESHYSKGQKNATMALMEYIDTGDEGKYAAYREELKIPLGDKLAREALLLPEPDKTLAYEGFLAGKNHPEDIPGMISFFIYFKSVYYVEEAIKHWTLADEQNLNLQAIGPKIRQAIADNDQKELLHLSFELRQIYQSAQVHQQDFSKFLSEGARWVKELLITLMVLIFFPLMLYVFIATKRVFKNIESQQHEKASYLKNYQKVLETSQEGFWIVNLEGKILEVNDAICQMEGYSRQELLRKYVFDIDDAIAKEDALNILQQIKKNGFVSFETVHRRKDGTLHPVEVTSSYLGGEDDKLFAFMRDVSDRKELEEQLKAFNKDLAQQVEEKTKALEIKTIELDNYFNTMQDGLGIADIRTKAFINCNRAFETLTGYSKEEMLNQSIEMLFPKDSLEYVMDSFERSARGEIKLANDIPVLHKNGAITICDVSAQAFEVDGNVYNVGVFRDVSERKIIEQELWLQKEKAESATKVKSEFLANMSHEIRTPMNSIIGMTDLALDTNLDDTQRNYIKKANIAAQNLLGIINDILDFSKIEAGKLQLSPSHFELKDIISGTLHLISIVAKDKDISTRVKLASNVPKYLFADAMRLSQVLLNLMTNAVKFSKDNGVVILEISLLEEDETSATVKFSVTDEGIGISPDNQKKLFKSFSQADSSTQKTFGGTGLGLVISKKIVELMHGDISLMSEEGKGSTFSFEIRMQKSSEDNLVQTTEDTQKVMEYALKKLQGIEVLLVEDNEMNQELAMSLLKKNGLHVTLAENGQEALDTLEEKRFDIVLMDVQMPIMDGYEATRRIRSQAKYKDLPILAMTANAMQEDVEQAKEAGMNEHISKPIDATRMFITMVQWLR